MFAKEAVLKLLENKDARFLRFYYARNGRGGRELILTASDADGNDLLTQDGGPLDHHLPCPPFCATNSALRG